MSRSNLIQDTPTRESVKELERVIERLEKIKQLPADASNKLIIDTINKITNSIKRK